MTKKTVIIGIILSIFCAACGSDYALPENDFVDIDLADPIEEPGKFSWEEYSTSIKDQWFCTTCWLYSTFGLVETQYNIEHKTKQDLDLSEEDLQDKLEIPCVGHWKYFIADVWNFIKKVGLIEEGGTAHIYKAEKFIFERFKDEVSVEERKEIIKMRLKNGPLVITPHNWSFTKDGYGVLYCDMEHRSVAGHAVVVVGYEDNGNILIIKNSHGGEDLIRIYIDNEDECVFLRDTLQVRNVYVEDYDEKQYQENVDFFKMEFDYE